MEQVTFTQAQWPGTVGELGRLPACRADWPDGARQAFIDVLRQLDGWCRERNRPRGTNVAIAEEAVRHVW